MCDTLKQIAVDWVTKRYPRVKGKTYEAYVTDALGVTHMFRVRDGVVLED